MKFLVIAALLLPTSFSTSWAYSECSVNDQCGQCRATCTEKAFCAAGEFDTSSKICLRRTACYCVGDARLKQLDQLLKPRLAAN